MKLSPITKEQVKKIVKATLYVGASAAISYLITLTTDQPELLGVLTPVVNIVLVTLKQAFTVAEPVEGK